MSCMWCWPLSRLRSTDRKTTSQLKQHDISGEDGLKLLYEGQSPLVDIVAVHGLNDHREKSWTAPNGVNWLQTLLPTDIPRIRVLTWGYSASTKESHSESPPLQRISEDLVSDLWKMREASDTHDHPIIFIAHSLGGSIVKSAILCSENMLHSPSMNSRKISDSTRGIIFMDTPELGPSTAGLELYLESLDASDQMATDTYKEARWLLDVLKQFSSISSRFDITYAVAKRNNEIAQRSQRKDASFSADELASHITIGGDHANMNKFSSANDEGYIIIKRQITKITEELSEI